MSCAFFSWLTPAIVLLAAASVIGAGAAAFLLCCRCERGDESEPWMRGDMGNSQ